jgi:transketolase
MLQITGLTEEVMGLEPLQAKFMAFGCAVRACNGNDIADLIRVFDALPFESGKPNLVIAQTVKGKGISFIENTIQWHHKVPSEAEYAAAMIELDRAEAALCLT